MTYQLPQRPIYQKGAQKPEKSKPLRDAARDVDCTLRVACGQIITDKGSVGCHARFFNFAGTSQKVDDLFLIDGCPSCHHILDHRNLWGEYGLGWGDILRALMESQARRRAAGLIMLKGEAE